MEKAALPKVSVCIPTYNYGHYITDAIESVRSQTYADFELLIIDDCSADNTREIVSDFQKQDSRIRYICNNARLGFAGNFSRCIELAAGEYVKILCADDVLEPTCLQKMVKALDEHSRVSLVSCSRQLVDKTLKPIGSSSYALKFVLQNGFDAARRCFLGVNNRIGEPSAVLFRKKDAARGFNGDYTLLVDLEMWLHLLEKGDFMFIPEHLCKIRQHEGQATNDCIKTLLFVKDLDRLYSEFFQKSYMRSSFISTTRWRFGATLNIWEKRHLLQNSDVIRESIGRYMNYRIAAVVMPIYIWMIRSFHVVRKYEKA